MGDEAAPNICTCISYTSGGPASVGDRHRNRRACVSSGRTLTWWNIPLMSPEIANFFSLSLKRIPIRLVKRSGPVNNRLLRETPRKVAAPSNTTRHFPGLLGLNTAWWGRYHVQPMGPSTSLSPNFLAWPWLI